MTDDPKPAVRHVNEMTPEELAAFEQKHNIRPAGERRGAGAARDWSPEVMRAFERQHGIRR